jgi:hypothetical protein
MIMSKRHVYAELGEHRFCSVVAPVVLLSCWVDLEGRHELVSSLWIAVMDAWGEVALLSGPLIRSLR